MCPQADGGGLPAALSCPGPRAGSLALCTGRSAPFSLGFEAFRRENGFGAKISLKKKKKRNEPFQSKRVYGKNTGST